MGLVRVASAYFEPAPYRPQQIICVLVENNEVLEERLHVVVGQVLLPRLGHVGRGRADVRQDDAGLGRHGDGVVGRVGQRAVVQGVAAAAGEITSEEYEERRTKLLRDSNLK